jgi:hypothetical protein
MDNQFTALNDFAIDNQLGFRDWLIAGANHPSVLVLFLDEVIEELAIFRTDIPSQRIGMMM